MMTTRGLYNIMINQCKLRAIHIAIHNSLKHMHAIRISKHPSDAISFSPCMLGRDLVESKSTIILLPRFVFVEWTLPLFNALNLEIILLSGVPKR